MSERFAIVHWEDKFKSIINLVNVRSPRISIADYAEGSYITALYQKRPYKARISEISDCNVDCETGPPERTPAKTSGLKTQEPDSDVHSVMPQESIPIDLKKSGQESSKSPGDIAGSQGSSKSPGDKLSSLTSRDRIRQLEGEVKSLKRRQKRLEDKFEELKKGRKAETSSNGGVSPLPSAGTPTQAETLGSITGITSFQSLVDSAKNINDTNKILKKLCMQVFTAEEIINSSRTGKKSAKSTQGGRPALDSSKFEMLERAALSLTGITRQEFLKKFENIQKMERRNQTKL